VPKPVFRFARHTDPRGLLFVAGIIAAAAVAWATCPIPPRHPLYVDSLLVFAAAHVLIVALAGAAVTFCSFWLFSANRDHSTAALWPSLLIAVWLSPMVILMWQRSLWAIVPLLWITAKTARLAFPGRVALPDLREESWLAKPFDFTPVQRESFFLWLPFLTAIVFQAGLTAEVIHERLAAILMTGLAVGTLIWLRRRGTEIEQRSLSRRSKIWRLLIALTIAILVSAAGMVSFLAFAGGFAEDSVASVLLRQLFWQRAAARLRAQNRSDQPSPFGRGGGYRGVVLWPEADPRPILLVPPPPKLSPEVFVAGPSRPVSFAFSGVYWFFKPPDVRPPEHSPRIRGNPAKMGLRSSDDYPLLMEAHQLFSSPVDLACCAQIQVVIKNADPGSGPVFLELAVANTSLAGRSQSLGSQRVRSQQPTGGAGEAEIAEETLTFAVPENPLVHDFDEMIFRFHRDYRRAGLSSRMAIEKLVLVPR
jgi:hypothetical protein